MERKVFEAVEAGEEERVRDERLLSECEDFLDAHEPTAPELLAFWRTYEERAELARPKGVWDGLAWIIRNGFRTRVTLRNGNMFDGYPEFLAVEVEPFAEGHTYCVRFSHQERQVPLLDIARVEVLGRG
jgi:hypothetical protein